jgi:hypothetical protein
MVMAKSVEREHCNLRSHLCKAFDSPPPWYAPKNCRVISDEQLAEAIQYLDAQAANMRDVDRLNRMGEIGGGNWVVSVGGRIVGKGHIRQAIDQAIVSTQKEHQND